jgi:hypothetical protein
MRRERDDGVDLDVSSTKLSYEMIKFNDVSDSYAFLLLRLLTGVVASRVNRSRTWGDRWDSLSTRRSPPVGTSWLALTDGSMDGCVDGWMDDSPWSTVSFSFVPGFVMVSDYFA